MPSEVTDEGHEAKVSTKATQSEALGPVAHIHTDDTLPYERLAQTVLPIGKVLPLKSLIDPDSEFEAVCGHVTVLNLPEIGFGGFGRILEADATIATAATSEPQRVALKVMIAMDSKARTLVQRELAAIRLLTEKRHANVVQFIGLCEHAEKVILVMPLLRNGNLLKYMTRLVDEELALRHRLIVEVAEAMNYLHTVAKLVHGDLKCENVLISDAGSALLADFGLSTVIEKAADEKTTATNIRIMNTLRFSAPELLLADPEGPDVDGNIRRRSKTTESDVFAFGMLVLQAYTGQLPWHGLNEQKILFALNPRQGGVVPKLDPYPCPGPEAFARGYSDRHDKICRQCWEYRPKARPRMEVVLRRLKRITYSEPNARVLSADELSSDPSRIGFREPDPQEGQDDGVGHTQLNDQLNDTNILLQQ